MVGILSCLLASAQTVRNKESGIMPKPIKLKDTTVYKIITQTQDTFYFGSDKKMKIKQSDAILSNTLRTTNKSLDILFHGDGALLMTLNLEISKQRDDTSAALSILDPTMIVRLYIERVYNCEIKTLQINNYKKVQQYAYHQRILNKFFDFKTTD
jgi:hypothetical protein